MKGRELLRAFFLENMERYSPDIGTAAFVVLQFVRAEPEYAMAMLAQVERDFEATPRGIPQPESVVRLFHEFAQEHPIEVTA